MEVLQGRQRSAALCAAIDLDLFTAIGEGKTTAADVAARTGASPKGIRVLCDFLTINGLLTKRDGHYGLTPDTAMFLDRRSQAYLGTATQFLNLIAAESGAFDNLTDVIKRGGTLMSGEGSMEPENPIWVVFARSMAPLMAMPAEGIAKILGAPEGKPWKVLDIAAGHGLFGIAIARQNPNAQIVAVDWTSVLEVAKENVAKAGVTARYSTIPGSAFDVDFGTGYDVALLTNFLHHFNVARCESLLRKTHNALKPGGRLLIFDFIPNEDRVSPAIDAAFSMTMLATTREGDAYTFSEYERMLRNSGYSRSEMRELTPLPNRVVIAYK